VAVVVALPAGAVAVVVAAAAVIIVDVVVVVAVDEDERRVPSPGHQEDLVNDLGRVFRLDRIQIVELDVHARKVRRLEGLLGDPASVARGSRKDHHLVAVWMLLCFRT
jgi:hypothetical protein